GLVFVEASVGAEGPSSTRVLSVAADGTKRYSVHLDVHEYLDLIAFDDGAAVVMSQGESHAVFAIDAAGHVTTMPPLDTACHQIHEKTPPRGPLRMVVCGSVEDGMRVRALDATGTTVKSANLPMSYTLAGRFPDGRLLVRQDTDAALLSADGAAL